MAIAIYSTFDTNKNKLVFNDPFGRPTGSLEIRLVLPDFEVSTDTDNLEDQ